jgi:hypothetical protein
MVGHHHKSSSRLCSEKLPILPISKTLPRSSFHLITQMVWQ